MPLPGIDETKQCTARAKRSGTRCRNPAVVTWGYPGTVCRMHGARRKSEVKRRQSHPCWKHGRETIEAKAERSRRLAELRELEALSFTLGLVPEGTPRWRGRKPKLSHIFNE